MAHNVAMGALYKYLMQPKCVPIIIAATSAL